MKDKKKVKAGQMRWIGVKKQERKRLARQAGLKGGAELWRKIRAGKLSPPNSEKVLDITSERE
jgi:hypothetical protein